MSTRRAYFTFRVGGALTDPDAIMLGDETATYGIKRNDTDAVIVANGTAPTRQSTGVYYKDFTYVNNVAYTAVWHVTHDAGAGSADYYFPKLEEAIVPPVSSGGISEIELDIVNSALIRIRQQPIADLTDTTDRIAVLVSTIFAGNREELLQMHPWKFATKRIVLDTVTPNTPAYNFGYQFYVPTDFLRIVIPLDQDTEYRFEQDANEDATAQVAVINTNESTFSMTYTANVNDARLFSPLFKRAFSLSLASDLCAILTGSDSMQQMVDRELDGVLAEARFQDARQSPAADTLGGSTFLTARLGTVPIGPEGITQ